VVSELTHNVRQLLESHKIDILTGTAALEGPGKVTIVSDKGETKSVESDNILLATGSTPIEVPAMAFDGKRIISSTEALALDEVPQHLGIVGGGYIGLELGSVWLRLGAKVTVIEMLPKIGTTLDGQVARTLERILRKQGFTFMVDTQVIDATANDQQVTVSVQRSGETQTLTFDRLLVSVGRRPLTQGLRLEQAGVKTDPKSGHILVDEQFQTSVPGIYAIGDLIPGPMLAHKASAEGIAAVESMAGHAGEVNYDTIPSVVYTAPEVASVGMTEEQVKQRQIPYCVGSYPFTGAGRARCMGETDGFVKLIAHSKTDRILGVHIIGPRAADMIAECVLAMEFGASSEDIARTIHGHPTFAEALQEAAMHVRKCAIYSS
jgi:dihydrolipoamide dehydrogenase